MSEPVQQTGDSFGKYLSEFMARGVREVMSAAQRLRLIESDVGELKRICTQLGEAVSSLTRITGELKDRVEELSKEVREANQTSKCLENSSREQALISERRYEEHVISPMLGAIVPLLDLVDEAKGNVEKNDEMKRDSGNIMEALSTGVRQFLQIYSVETFASTPGAAFDRRSMQPVQFEPTRQQELNMTVVRSLRCGVRRGERLLRSECVVLYRFEEQVNGPDASSGTSMEFIVT